MVPSHEALATPDNSQAAKAGNLGLPSLCRARQQAAAFSCDQDKETGYCPECHSAAQQMQVHPPATHTHSFYDLIRKACFSCQPETL